MVETGHATGKWRMLGIGRELLVESLRATRVTVDKSAASRRQGWRAYLSI